VVVSTKERLIFLDLLKSLAKAMAWEPNMPRLLAMEHVKSIEVKEKDNGIFKP
jgi:hypothetical protein